MKGFFMPNLDEIIQVIESVKGYSSGSERDLYETLERYVQTGDRYYVSKIKKLYKHLDYSAQQRADQVYKLLFDNY